MFEDVDLWCLWLWLRLMVEHNHSFLTFEKSNKHLQASPPRRQTHAHAHTPVPVPSFSATLSSRFSSQPNQVSNPPTTGSQLKQTPLSLPLPFRFSNAFYLWLWQEDWHFSFSLFFSLNSRHNVVAYDGPAETYMYTCVYLGGTNEEEPQHGNQRTSVRKIMFISRESVVLTLH